MTTSEGIGHQEGYWQDQIKNGPNARLYEKLHYIRASDERCYFFADLECKGVLTDVRLTEEEWYIGVATAFFGYHASDVIAQKFYNRGHVDLFRREAPSVRMQRQLTGVTESLEQRRIQELEQGEFSLPQNIDGLLENIDLQIKRLETHPDRYSQRRIEALKRTREKIDNWASTPKSKPHIYDLNVLE